MATPAFNEAFVIANSDKNGKFTEIYPYYTNIATYVSMSINLVLRLSETSLFEQALSTLADKVLPQSKESWRMDLPDEEVASIFIAKIHNRYPITVIERFLTNPDVIAFIGDATMPVTATTLIPTPRALCSMEM